MEGFISFILFAAFFYVMMRYGCGAHMIHGHHDSHDHGDADAAKFIDPVCGKEVESDQGYGVMHKGELYRFCSRKCLDVFDDQIAKEQNKNEEDNHV